MKIIQWMVVIFACLKHSCSQHGMSTEMPYMLVSTIDGIMQINMDDVKDYRYLVKEFGISAFDYHYKKNLLFWANELVPSIKVTSLNISSEATEIYTSEMHSPTGMAVDWLHDRVYWVERNNGVIRVYDLNTETVSVVFKMSSFSFPSKLKVLPHMELLFWGDKYKKGIQKLSITGSKGEVQILKDVSCPDALALNYKSGSLYVIDGCKTTFKTIKFDGSDEKTILRRVPGGTLVTGISVYNDRLFWTMQSDSATVRYIEIEDKSSVDYFKLYYNIFSDIAIVHSSNQPSEVELVQYTVCGTICYHGNCSADGLCHCENGWQGSDCSDPSDPSEYQRNDGCEKICKILSGVYSCNCKVSTDTLEDQSTKGPEDEPKGGPEDQPTSGPEDEPTGGLEDEPTSGPEDEPTSGPEDDSTSGPEDDPTEDQTGQTGGQEDTETVLPDQQVDIPEDDQTSGPEDQTRSETEEQSTSRPTHLTTLNLPTNSIQAHVSSRPAPEDPTNPPPSSQGAPNTTEPNDAQLGTGLEVSSSVTATSGLISTSDSATHNSDTTSTPVGGAESSVTYKIETSEKNRNTRDSTTIPSTSTDEFSSRHTNNGSKLTPEMREVVSTYQRPLLGNLGGEENRLDVLIVAIVSAVAFILLFALLLCAFLVCMWKQRHHSGKYSVYNQPDKRCILRRLFKHHRNCEGGDQSSHVHFKGITWSYDSFSSQEQTLPIDEANVKIGTGETHGLFVKTIQ